jgi:glycosyltransferase involved in cell wall biosynthesis
VQVWDICGIAGLLSRYLMKYHWNYYSRAIARTSHDPFHHYGVETIAWDNNSKVWIAKAIYEARKYDILHIHCGINWLKYYKLFYPNKHRVLHLHGTKIRGKWNDYDLSDADMILVSTPDLLEGSPKRALYLPNPVDEELINHINELDQPKIKGAAFHVNRFALDKAEEYAQERGLKLTVFNRDRTPLPHKEFLKEMAKYEYYINVERTGFLNEISKFEYYIDVKRDYPTYAYEDIILEALSLTGLEALALGCKVINWNNEVLEGLPNIHRSINVANKLNMYYTQMLLGNT